METIWRFLKKLKKRKERDFLNYYYLHLKMKRVWHREVKLVAQGHRASKQHGRHLNPGSGLQNPASWHHTSLEKPGTSREPRSLPTTSPPLCWTPEDLPAHAARSLESRLPAPGNICLWPLLPRFPILKAWVRKTKKIFLMSYYYLSSCLLYEPQGSGFIKLEGELLSLLLRNYRLHNPWIHCFCPQNHAPHPPPNCLKS